MDTNERTALIAELEASKMELQRCMGGVDPIAGQEAAQRITELRLKLRDDSAMFAHLAECVRTPLSVPKHARARRRA